MPVNDADFNHAAPLPDGLAVHEESFYPFEKIDAAESADNIKIFSEEALRLEKERLNAVALVELAKILKPPKPKPIWSRFWKKWIFI